MPWASPWGVTNTRRLAMFRPRSILLLAIAATFLAAGAHAQAPNTTTVSVDFRDLDLARMGDARILFARIEEAAKRACGPTPFMQPLYGVAGEGLKRTYKQCRAQAVGDAVTRINAPLVSRV